MKMFGNLTTDGLEQVTDRLGGYQILDTGAYPAKIKLAYAGKAASSDASSIVIHMDINGFEHRETFWVTSKTGANSYPDPKDASKRIPLMGFTMVDDLCLLTTGQPLSEQTAEEKIVSLYDYDAKRDIPKPVHVLLDLLGKEIMVGLVRQTVDKNVKSASGEYLPSGDTRDENVTDKFFHPETHRTVSEYKAQVDEATFYPKWVTKNKDVTRNRAKGATGNGGSVGRPGMGAGPGAGMNQQKKSSLFAT